MLHLDRDWVYMQGNSDELKIFLQIRLIDSRIDQKLRKEEKYIDFYKENFATDVSRPSHYAICVV